MSIERLIGGDDIACARIANLVAARCRIIPACECVARSGRRRERYGDALPLSIEVCRSAVCRITVGILYFLLICIFDCRVCCCNGFSRCSPALKRKRLGNRGCCQCCRMFSRIVLIVCYGSAVYKCVLCKLLINVICKLLIGHGSACRAVSVELDIELVRRPCSIEIVCSA